MTIDAATAAQLGFPNPKHSHVERERRWLCSDVPSDLVREVEVINDLYVNGTCLRLRDVQPLDGRTPTRRVTRKADVDASTRLYASIYLSEAEHQILVRLPGDTIRKARHRLVPIDGAVMAVDRFEGNLSGLILAECEFDSEIALKAFRPPSFVVREVTHDMRYCGGALIASGLPAE